MTELERIEIEGFKGIESLAFEPSQINLITGRNNTGKTSLLESIKLSASPSSISAFGKDVDKIINTNSDVCDIKVEFCDNDIDIRLVYPDRKERWRNLVEASIQSFENPENSVFIDWPGSSEIEDVSDEYMNSLKEALSSKSKEARQADLGGGGQVIAEINGERYPFLYIGEGDERDLADTSDSAVRNLVDEIGITNKSDARIRFSIHNSLITKELDINELGSSSNSVKVPYIDRHMFLKDPPTFNEVYLLTSLKPPNKEAIDKNEAVRVDDISDYIKQNEIVDGLKTFNLDYLIFESDEGEKHQIPFEFMGDGFKSVVGLLWELLDDEVENEIVLIEEPENHMHPGYVREVVDFLIQIARDEDIQLFITTHDNDFINDFFYEHFPNEHREFLEEEFTLVQMQEHGAQVLDYETAENDLKDLHLDLRGI